MNFDQAADLSGLNSYRANYTFTWESTDDGETERGSWAMEQEVVRQPPANRLRWGGSESGQDAEDAYLEIIEVGDKVYFNSGSGWMEVDSAEDIPLGQETLLNDPLGIVSGSRGRLLERGVTVNGIRADHYTFEETGLGSGLGLGAIAKAEGDLWLSTEYGVVVRYVARFEAEELALAGGESGMLEMAFELSDLNRPISIVAPIEFQAAMPEDIPILDDSTELSAFMGTVTYKTAKSAEEAGAFYDAQMPLLGWTREGGFAALTTFTKGARTAQVIILDEGTQTTVTVTTGEQ